MKILKRHRITHSERDTIIRRIREFLGKEPVLFAYLYGSFASENEFNDIDLAVYLDEEAFSDDQEIFDRALSLSARLDVGYEVEVHPLNLVPLSYRFCVINKGQLIYEGDRRSRIEFEVRTRDLYFDFRPHREFYFRRIVLGEKE